VDQVAWDDLRGFIAQRFEEHCSVTTEDALAFFEILTEKITGVPAAFALNLYESRFQDWAIMIRAVPSAQCHHGSASRALALGHCHRCIAIGTLSSTHCDRRIVIDALSPPNCH
jgi:hypothetical protein